MSFFGIFGKLTKTVINTALLPVDAASDVLTLGGALTDDDSALEKRVEKIGNALDELGEEVDDL